MGFEVTYHYHEEIAKGEYNKEEIKTKTIKVGNQNDETPLELLAGKIMAQLARRNILVVDVEIYEFTKKKISYKEADDGILIKNKKFSFDEGGLIGNSMSETDVETSSDLGGGPCVKPQDASAQLLALLTNNPQILSLLTQQQQPGTNQMATVVKAAVPATVPHGTKPPSILRYEIFNPIDKIFLQDAKRRKLAFTLGKKYPIITERKAKNEMVGMLYNTIDDDGKRQVMSDKFFTPDVGRLERDFEPETFRPAATAGAVRSDGLDWSSFTEDKIPDIRR